MDDAREERTQTAPTGQGLYVQCLPKQQDVKSRFHQHQMAIKEDLVRKLKRRGVKIVDDLQGNSEVLILLQSTGRVGDELPAALKDLDQHVKNSVDFLAVIQDSEYGTVGRDALPAAFKPQHLLNFVVVPGTSQLKDCAANVEALSQVASFADVSGALSLIWDVWSVVKTIFMFVLGWMYGIYGWVIRR